MSILDIKPRTEPRELEEQLLSIIINEPVYMQRHMPHLMEELFTFERRVIFSVIRTIPLKKLNLTTLTEELRKLNSTQYGGLSNIADIATIAADVRPGVVDSLIRQLYERRARSVTRKTALELMSAAEDNAVNIYKTMEEARTSLLPNLPTHELRKADDIIKEIMDPNKTASYFMTKIPAVDKFTQGMPPGELTIVAGAPSMGKTASVLHMFKENVKAGTPIGFFSLEMTDTQLLQRVVSSDLHIENSKLRAGILNDEEAQQIIDYKEMLDEQRWFIDYRSRKLSTISSLIQAKADEGYKAFIIDYLQLMNAGFPPGQREREVATISRELKELCTSENINIIALSQLNRNNQNRSNKKPTLSDLRESGAIEQDADNVIFVHRDTYYNLDGSVKEQQLEEMDFIFGKGRQIGTGSVQAHWNRKYTRIE